MESELETSLSDTRGCAFSICFAIGEWSFEKNDWQSLFAGLKVSLKNNSVFPVWSYMSSSYFLSKIIYGPLEFEQYSLQNNHLIRWITCENCVSSFRTVELGKNISQITVGTVVSYATSCLWVNFFNYFLQSGLKPYTVIKYLTFLK